jgi:MSHA biogenesis protein MshO
MKRLERGFTLIELVVTLVVAGIVVGFMALFLVVPVHAHFAQVRRTELTDSADTAMRILSDDIRKALPRSVRYSSTGSGFALEMLETVDVARYRPSGTPNQQLDFGTVEKNFDVLGPFSKITPPLDVHYLVVGYAGGDYPTSGVITPATDVVSISRPVGTNEDAVSIGPSGAIFTATPNERVFLVDTPVAYLCDITAGITTLTRFSNYPIAPLLAAHDDPAELAAAESHVVARNVTGCTVSSVPGTPQRGELVLLQLTISGNGDVLQVMHEVSVENTP